ncbi:TPA: hypothetical protein ACOEAI_000195 [Enterobacter hormaechei subsp. xiangfangensis]|nr:hypothetical protein [Enterobacter hormaechei]MCE1929022.1 hypothetical protein [Enterobacter hormaechei]HCR1046648.1 hypothetical protein [Enterobacter hormaechei]
MRTLTKEWLLKTIAELEEERDATPGAVNEDATNALAAMKLALASLEAKPLGYIDAEYAEILKSGHVESCSVYAESGEGCFPVYTAPPAPVSVPDALPENDDEEGNDIDYMEPSEVYAFGRTAGWNACRAAMLQGVENAETPTTMQTAPALDYSPKIAESPSGNSPVIPDCWCRTCRPVVLNDMRFVVCPDCGNKRCPRANDHKNSCTGSNEPGQEGSAYPASPQEVKGE